MMKKHIPSIILIVFSLAAFGQSNIRKQVATRYAWTGSPVESNGANVFNAEGFPLSPFRTDNWKSITEGKK
jgi:sialate O-acetylesterase